jgi:hypothetical protein
MHHFDRQTLVVEWEHVDEGEAAIVTFMEESGFVNFGKIATPYARDIVFVKDFLRFGFYYSQNLYHLLKIKSFSFSDLRYDYDD